VLENKDQLKDVINNEIVYEFTDSSDGQRATAYTERTILQEICASKGDNDDLVYLVLGVFDSYIDINKNTPLKDCVTNQNWKCASAIYKNTKFRLHPDEQGELVLLNYRNCSLRLEILLAEINPFVNHIHPNIQGRYLNCFPLFSKITQELVTNYMNDPVKTRRKLLNKNGDSNSAAVLVLAKLVWTGLLKIKQNRKIK